MLVQLYFSFLNIFVGSSRAHRHKMSPTSVSTQKSDLQHSANSCDSMTKALCNTSKFFFVLFVPLLKFLGCLFFISPFLFFFFISPELQLNHFSSSTVSPGTTNIHKSHCVLELDEVSSKQDGPSHSGMHISLCLNTSQLSVCILYILALNYVFFYSM